MNEQNNHAALTIAQQYPPAQYNLLVPMQTVTEIADIQKPVMNSVSISTNLNDGEIYEMEKAKDEWRDSKGYVHKATPAKYALTKKGLTKLMRAAGIKILSSRPVVPSTCQKCAEVNRSIGKPIRCGGCPNKDVKHEVRISVPQLTGENVTIVAHKEIAVEDVTAGMAEKQRAEFMKFRSEMCESKALNRALRTAMQIKSSYLIEEFKKPFVVAYLVPNLDNPAVREEAVKSMFGAANDLYGSRPKTSHTVYAHAANNVNFQTDYDRRVEKIGAVVDGCSLLLEYLTICTEEGIISAKKAGIWTKKVTDVKYPAMKWLTSERGRAEKLRAEAERKRLTEQAAALKAVLYPEP